MNAPSRDEDVDWPALVAAALAGHPERLVGLLRGPEIDVPGFHWCRPSIPAEVQSVVNELRRARKGRPSKADPLWAAAKAWQRKEARTIYEWSLQGYQLAKDADLTHGALEVIGVGGSTIRFNVSSRSPVVRGGGLSPKELAIESTAEAMGRSADAIRRLLFARKKR